MKTFPLNEKKKGAAGHSPWSMVARALAFTLMLLGMLILLLMLPRGCDNKDKDNPYEDLPFVDPVINDSIPVDTMPQHDFGPDVPLPDPEDNVITPPEEWEEDSLTGREIAPDRLNVILDKNKGEQTIALFAQRFKEEYPDDAYQIIYFDELTYLLQISVPQGSVPRMLHEMPQRLSDFSFKLFQEERFQQSMRPSDPFFKDRDKAWYFNAIQAYEAWDITQGSEEVTIAVVDNYFDLNHDEMRGKVVYPFNVERRSTQVGLTRDMLDNAVAILQQLIAQGMPNAQAMQLLQGYVYSCCHGANVAALASAQVNNGAGMSGIAPKCKVMPVGVFSDRVLLTKEGLANGSTSMMMVSGILYALYKGADVINISMGSYFGDQVKQLSPEEQMEIIRNDMNKRYGEQVWDYIFDLAEERNCVIVWAAGNETILAGMDCSKRNNNTIRVSALGQNLRPAKFSNFGYDYQGQNGGRDFSTVSAPGVNMWGCAHGNGYCSMEGTSQAAPIVTGAVALLKSVDRTLSARQIIDILQRTGKRIPGAVGPMIQIRDALQQVKGELLDYDDAVKDPKAMLGIWESTTPLYESKTGKPIKMYFRFTSPSRGQLVVKIISTGETYKAGLNVSRQNNGLQIVQPDYGVSNRGDQWSRYIYDCQKGDDGKLKVVGKNRDENQGFDCYMRRVDRIP